MSRKQASASGETRYEHTGVGGGHQDQGERKDEGWTSRQGGEQSRSGSGTGSGGGRGAGRAGREQPPKPLGSNTQGELAGIAEAADESESRLRSEGYAADEIPEGGHVTEHPEPRH